MVKLPKYLHVRDLVLHSSSVITSLRVLHSLDRHDLFVLERGGSLWLVKTRAFAATGLALYLASSLFWQTRTSLVSQVPVLVISRLHRVYSPSLGSLALERVWLVCMRGAIQMCTCRYNTTHFHRSSFLTQRNLVPYLEKHFKNVDF